MTYRICDVCGVVDEGPRHRFFTEPDSFPVNQAHLTSVLENLDIPTADKIALINDIQDTGDQTRHFDCCAAVGCPAPPVDAETGLPNEANCSVRTGG